MYQYSAFLSIWLGLLTSQALATCQPRPLYIPIEDVEISNGAKIRGISLKMGSSPQNISLFASADLNETYVYGTKGLCGKAYTDQACMSYRGGLYNASSSTSESRAESRHESDQTDAEWIKDTWHISSDATFDNVTFGVPNQDLNSEWISQAQLGLGRNSSLLHMLKNAGYIGSRAYSVFWGLVGGPESQQTSGALTLGGIDQGLAGTSLNYTGMLNYNSKCSTGMLVTINDISLNWPNGTDSSIFGGSQSSVIQACIAPSFAGLMTIPYVYWSKFQQLAGGSYPNGTETRSQGINYFTMLYEPDDVYYGDLTITLQNSISIRIPNTELVVPEPVISNATGEVVRNNDVRNLVLNSIQDTNADDLPVIGRLFLTAAYLSVNHDSNTFSLWQANARAEMGTLSALDETNGLSDTFCGSESTKAKANATTSSTPPLFLASMAPIRLSGGAIGGIVGGAIVVIGILTAGFAILRRKKRKNALKITPGESRDNVPLTTVYHRNLDFLENTSGMSAKKGWRAELAGKEMKRSNMEIAELDGRAF